MNILSTDLLTTKGKIISACTLTGVSFVVLKLIQKYANGGQCPTELLKKSLSEKVIVITGATNGIGFETALQLSKQNPHKIIVPCRNVSEGKESFKKVGADLERFDFFEMDLGDLESVYSFVEWFAMTYDRIDMVICNAGIMHPPHGMTNEGIEIQFGVNHLGHYFLIDRMLNRVKNVNDKIRIVNVSSLAHFGSSRLLSRKELMSSCEHLSKFDLYNHSKMTNILFTKGLQRCISEQYGVKEGVVVALHPGVIPTNLWKHHYVVLQKMAELMGKILFKSVKSGAQTTLYCALEEDEKLVKGGYYADCVNKKSSIMTYSTEEQDKLFQYSREICRPFSQRK